MEDLKPNSDKYREERRKELVPVVSGKTKKNEKSEIQKFGEALIPEDRETVKSYIIYKVLVPFFKRALVDGLNVLLYGEGAPKSSDRIGEKVSYRNRYNPDQDRPRQSVQRGIRDYDQILFDERGDAEVVLEAMNDVIERYQTVSVADMYELAEYPFDNYTLNNYGWSDISSAKIMPVRDGYIIKLPRPFPLK